MTNSVLYAHEKEGRLHEIAVAKDPQQAKLDGEQTHFQRRR